MRWKSIDTNPPADGTECLFTDGTHVFLGTWSQEQNECFIKFCKTTQTLIDFNEVGHWIAVSEIMKLAKR
jgi:hypothetical protein